MDDDDLIRITNITENVLTNNDTSISQYVSEKSYEGFSVNEHIRIPKTFLNVILKTFPEFEDVKTIGYSENKIIDPNNFTPIFKYLVGVDIYFNEPHGNLKSKEDYQSHINDYFIMTYPEIDFVTFQVQSLIIPPEKTNREKFIELFGVS